MAWGGFWSGNRYRGSSRQRLKDQEGALWCAPGAIGSKGQVSIGLSRLHEDWIVDKVGSRGNIILEMDRFVTFICLVFLSTNAHPCSRSYGTNEDPRVSFSKASGVAVVGLEKSFESVDSLLIIEPLKGPKFKKGDRLHISSDPCDPRDQFQYDRKYLVFVECLMHFDSSSDSVTVGHGQICKGSSTKDQKNPGDKCDPNICRFSNGSRLIEIKKKTKIDGKSLSSSELINLLRSKK